MMSNDFTVHAWATADSTPCVHPRDPSTPKSCVAVRTKNTNHYTTTCMASATCTHSSAVVRPSATWCYLRVGPVAWAYPARCLQRVALRRTLQPAVIIPARRAVIRWPELTALEWRDRTNCTAILRGNVAAQLHAQRTPIAGNVTAGSIDERFAQSCGPGTSFGAYPTADVATRLGQLRSAGFTQRRLGPFGNVARSRLQMHCLYDLARYAAQQAQAMRIRRKEGVMDRGRFSARQRRSRSRGAAGLRVCETGFNAGHSAILLLSALEAQAMAAQDSDLPEPALYHGLDLGSSEWSHAAADFVNTSLFAGQVRIMFCSVLEFGPVPTSPTPLLQGAS